MQALDSFVADRISAHRAYTPEGYLVCLGVPIARTGYQTYKAEEIDKTGQLKLTGLVDVYRSPEEVFKQSAVKSFEGKSVVSPHPPQFLNPDNDSLYAKGHAQNLRKGPHPETGEDVLLGDLVIKDTTLIHQIEDGHRVEVSGGYTYDLKQADDEFSPRSRFEQHNICGNHVAIVPTGRAGSNIKVLDASLEEGGEPMAEPVVSEKQPGMLAELATFCKTLGLRLVASDEDPGAVERNKKKDEEALKLKSRVEDEKTAEPKDDEKEEKEDKKAGPPKAKAQGADADEAKKEGARDSKLDRLIDCIDKLVAHKAEDGKKCICDAEEGEPHSKKCAMHKEESEDADLIPIKKLHGDEIPKNPIPGADAALEQLRKVRPVIAQSGDRQAIDAYNKAVKQLKAASEAEDNEGADYGDFLGTKKPEKVEMDEAKHRVSGKDSAPLRGAEAGEAFEQAAKKFHRMNANQVPKQ
jgi:uncharacterized protein